MRQLLVCSIQGVSSTQVATQERSVWTWLVRHLHECLSLAWIISARRILSAIFAVTDGDGLISSLFSRTAAISEAAMSIAAFDLFSS
jgi:hypothetical protein